MRKGFERVILTDVDERTAPATLPVLQVVVVGPTTFLTIAQLDETNKTVTLTNVATVGVDTKALMDAILGGQD